MLLPCSCPVHHKTKQKIQLLQQSLCHFNQDILKEMYYNLRLKSDSGNTLQAARLQSGLPGGKENLTRDEILKHHWNSPFPAPVPSVVTAPNGAGSVSTASSPAVRSHFRLGQKHVHPHRQTWETSRATCCERESLREAVW